MIHILDGQTDLILDYITFDNIIEDNHKKSLTDTLETYDFIALNKEYAEHLEKRNRIIIPDEDDSLREFIIFNNIKYKDSEGYKVQVIATASYLELKKASIVYPGEFTGTASQHGGRALNDTGWQIGLVEVAGNIKIGIETHTNPYEYLKRIAKEFEGELRFRIEHDGTKITGRYVDILERVGEWQGREVEFGKDLDSIRRIEKQDIVTALLGLGPENENGNRLEVLVEDEDALQRWGRIDEHGNLKHLIEPYEIQSERLEMTEEEARQYTRTALDKRINTQVTYETTIVDLEDVAGMENKKIRYGDTIRIKDTHFHPPLYLEARVFEMNRSIKRRAKKDIKLGDYIEYTEEEVNAIWKQLQKELQDRLARLVIATVVSSSGNVFKNGVGITELTAKTFINGKETDGINYDFQWIKFDKNGDQVNGWVETGKSINVSASDIDEKATYRVLIAYGLDVVAEHEITISNIFDGEDGGKGADGKDGQDGKDGVDGKDGDPGPQGIPGEKGADGKTYYTWVKYADSPTSGMSDNPNDKDYIGIAYNKESPTMSTNYNDYTWSLYKGPQGIPGQPGKDGEPTFTWVKYADTVTGSGMSDSPDGKKYIGLAFNKTTANESNNASDYQWSLMPQNITVGGVNLIHYTRPTDTNVSEWVSIGSYTSLSTRQAGGYDYIRLGISADVETGNYPRFRSKYVTRLIYGKTYTVSWKALHNNYVSDEAYGGIYNNSGIIKQNFRNAKRELVRQVEVANIMRNEYKYTFTFTFNDAEADERLYGIYLGAEYTRQNPLAAWVYFRDIKIEEGDVATSWSPAPEDVQRELDQAKQEAENAQTTADGKNSIYPQANEPSKTGRKVGDAWFREMSDGSMVIYDFNGTDWVKRPFGEQSLIANSITANHIKSLEGLNVNDQFIVDNNGNVKYAGDLQGASGTFGEVTATEGQFFTNTEGGQKYLSVIKSNLMLDHSFEFIRPDPSGIAYFNESAWIETGSPRWTAFRSGGGVYEPALFDEFSLEVNSSNYVRQFMMRTLVPNKTYTLSVHHKAKSNNTNIRLRVRVYSANSANYQDFTQTFPSVSSEVRRNSITFTMPSHIPIEFPQIHILSTSANWVIIDGVQLVEGNYMTIYEPEGALAYLMRPDAESGYPRMAANYFAALGINTNSVNLHTGTHLYLRPNGEVRVTAPGTAGVDFLMPIRASEGRFEEGVYTNGVVEKRYGGGEHLYLRAAGEIRATVAGSTSSYIDMRAAAHPIGSSILYKTNYEELTLDEALYLLDNAHPVKYHLQGNVDRGIYDKVKLGFFSETVPPQLRDEDGVDNYSITVALWRVVQELRKELEDTKKTLRELMEIM